MCEKWNNSLPSLQDPNFQGEGRTQAESKPRGKLDGNSWWEEFQAGRGGSFIPDAIPGHLCWVEWGMGGVK